jgi:hypothetical protein
MTRSCCKTENPQAERCTLPQVAVRFSPRDVRAVRGRSRGKSKICKITCRPVNISRRDTVTPDSNISQQHPCRRLSWVCSILHIPHSYPLLGTDELKDAPSPGDVRHQKPKGGVSTVWGFRVAMPALSNKVCNRCCQHHGQHLAAARRLAPSITHALHVVAACLVRDSPASYCTPFTPFIGCSRMGARQKHPMNGRNYAQHHCQQRCGMVGTTVCERCAPAPSPLSVVHGL